MADQLKMTAVVEDRATAPLRKIKEELAAFRETEGMKTMRESMKVLREQTGDFMKAAGGASAVIGGMGVVGLGASLSFGKIAEAMGDLAKRSGNLKTISQETGLSMKVINDFGRVASRFGLDQGEMDQALRTWGDKMLDFRRHTGDLYAEMNNRDPQLVKRILGENPEAQLNDVMKWIAQQAPQVRHRFSEMIFGDGDISHLLRDGYGALEQQLARVAALQGASFEDLQKQSQVYTNSMSAFGDAMENLKLQVAPTLFKGLTEIADEFTHAVNALTPAYDKAAEWMKRQKPEDFPLLPRRALEDAVKAGANALQQSSRELQTGGAPDGDTGLHRDEGWGKQGAPAPSQSERNWFSRMIHRSAFTTFGGEGGTTMAGASGAIDSMQKAVRGGVLQGLQDYADLARSGASGGAGGAGGPGFMNASYETGTGGGGSAANIRLAQRQTSDNGSAQRVRRRGWGNLVDDAVGKFDQGKTFASKAPQIMDRLNADFGLTPAMSAKILGNLGHESTGFTAYHEGGKSTGTGGIGWAQWTGARRREYEAWASANHLDTHSDEANYGFLKHELKGKYASAIAILKRGGSLENFEQIFEGAGVKAYGSRHRYERSALDAYVREHKRKERPSVWEGAFKSGAPGDVTVNHKGGAEITIKGLPSGVSARSKTDGLIDSVRLARSSTMPVTMWE